MDQRFLRPALAGRDAVEVACEGSACGDGGDRRRVLDGRPRRVGSGGAVERYLAHLAGIERSPDTARAYAHGLRLWFEFLGARHLVWDSVGIEDVSRFVAWLRAPADNVIVFDDTAAVRSAATENRHLAALFGFYDFHARSGLRPHSTRSPGSRPTTTSSENTSPSTSATSAKTASPPRQRHVSHMKPKLRTTTASSPPDKNQQPDQTRQTRRLRIHQLRQLPHQSPALRRQTQLGTARNPHSDLKREEPQ